MSNPASIVARSITALACIGHALTRPRYVVDQERWTRNPSNSPLVCGVSDGLVYILRQLDPVERGEGKGKGGIAMPLPSDPTRGAPAMVAPADMMSVEGVRAWIDPNTLGSGVDPIKLAEFVRGILSGAGIDVSSPETFALIAAKGAKVTTRRTRDEHEPAIIAALGMIGVKGRETLAALFTTPDAAEVCPLIALVTAAKGAGLIPSDSLLGAMKGAGERVAVLGDAGKGLASIVAQVVSSLPAATPAIVAPAPTPGASTPPAPIVEGASTTQPAPVVEGANVEPVAPSVEPVGAGASTEPAAQQNGKGGKGGRK